MIGGLVWVGFCIMCLGLSLTIPFFCSPSMYVVGVRMAKVGAIIEIIGALISIIFILI